MTSPSGWWGSALDGDQSDLQAMLDDFVAAHEPKLEDDPEVVAWLVAELASLGIWTLGTAEFSGGGGAGRGLTLVALERLGRAWPALGWAAVQAHAAVDLLTGDDRFTDLVSRVHAGTSAVAVVDAGSDHVHISHNGKMISGTVDRIDAAAENPYLLVLTGDDTATLVTPAALDTGALRRIGFDGALTRSLQIEATGGQFDELTGVDVVAARVRLRLGGAALAAGIAGAAADAAANYAAGRHQFGDTLTAIPAVRQSLLHQATGAVVTLAGVTTATDTVQSLAALREACDGAIEVATTALQSHGGYGYLAEYDAERRLRDAVSLRAAIDVKGAATVTARTFVSRTPSVETPRKDGS